MSHLNVERAAVNQRVCPNPSKTTAAAVIVSEELLHNSQSSLSPDDFITTASVLHETSSNTHIKAELHSMSEISY